MARQVAFAPAEVARDPLSDEREVMRAFHSHVGRCDTCYDALASWDPNYRLCERGHRYTVDMRPYFFEKNGKVFSKTDKRIKKSNVRILVPQEYRHVATLFAGLAEGFLTKPNVPRVVIQQSAAPPVQAPEPRRYAVIPERHARHTEPRAARRHEKYYEDRIAPSSRGSLYYEDVERRPRHRPVVHAEPTRYHI